MKKIVGILAASAVLATSVFAADVAAKVKLTGSVLTYDLEASSAKGFDVNRAGKADPMFTLSIDDTTVGATVKLDIKDVETVYQEYDGTKNVEKKNKFEAFQPGDTTIWFKPMDMLKVTVGNGAAPGLAGSLEEGENIIGDARLTLKKTAGIAVGDSAGYGVEVAIDAITINGYIGGGYATPFYGPTDKTVKNARAKVTYAADGVGTIEVLAASQDNFTENFFGASYKNSFDALTVMAEAGVSIGAGLGKTDETELNSVDFLASAKYTLDALTVAGDVFGQVYTFDKASDNLNSVLFLSIFAKVSYAMGNMTPYLLVKAENLTETQKTDKMQITIKPGVDGTFGLLSWATGVEITIKDKANKIDVPVEFSVAF